MYSLDRIYLILYANIVDKILRYLNKNQILSNKIKYYQDIKNIIIKIFNKKNKHKIICTISLCM